MKMAKLPREASINDDRRFAMQVSAALGSELTNAQALRHHGQGRLG